MENWIYKRQKSEFYNPEYCLHIPWRTIHKQIQNELLMYMYSMEKDNRKWNGNKKISKDWDKWMVLFLEQKGFSKYQFYQFLIMKYPKHNTACLAHCFDYCTNTIDEKEYALLTAIESI